MEEWSLACSVWACAWACEREVLVHCADLPGAGGKSRRSRQCAAFDWLVVLMPRDVTLDFTSASYYRSFTLTFLNLKCTIRATESA